MAEPFVFFECTPVERMTGRHAKDVVDFLEILKQISPASIFHHMHQYFLKPHVAPPEYPNDFTCWIADCLEEKVLAERLANLNPFEFSDIEEVRGELMRIITNYLKENRPPRAVREGKEFFFNEGITIVIPTGLQATNLQEFKAALDEVDPSCIYYHFYEARLRLGRKDDDFSCFFSDCFGGECAGLAERIRKLDPYMYTAETLKNKLVALVADAMEDK
ncbi:hypothetical protein MNBD_DELTA01-1534 [hydrothermal vent metagenome]|uniref:Uncharacterized protein n=1 Tax=hydrothermal vent metagenome TaxID=652676 RepID=A0A3B0R608_9ZZZZ